MILEPKSAPQHVWSLWSQFGPRGGDSNPGPLGTKSRVLDHAAPGGHSHGESSPRGIIPLGNHPPGESSPWGSVPLGNHPLGNRPLGNRPPGESSPWGIFPLGNRPPSHACYSARRHPLAPPPWGTLQLLRLMRQVTVAAPWARDDCSSEEQMDFARPNGIC